LRGVRVVLVRPGVPANIGAAARAVRNAGLAGLDLVAPCDWRTVECWRTAWGAHDVLEQARVFPDLPHAVASAGLVVGFSGRSAGSAALDVRDAARELATLRDDEGAALVFGPETSGLSDAELASCGRRARIPTDPAQPSLNLSHAVAIAGYEVCRARRHGASAGPRRATHAEKERMLGLLREGLLSLRALPLRNTDGHFERWRALLQRADLTPKEVRLLEHAARRMVQPGD
jgi:TrmH family RNA methyltransferase